MHDDRCEAESGLRVIIAQMGARHNYALPRMLHRRGALERFYTDTFTSEPIARLAAAWPAGLDSPIVGKLRRRTIEGVPHSVIYSSRWVNLRGALAFRTSMHERYRIEDEAFGRQMIEWGVGGANVVYGVYGSGLPFWRHARERGLKVAADIFITPLYHRIVAREREAFPDWEEPAPENAADRELTDQVSREHIEAADLLLCPCQSVADDLRTFARELTPPIEVVPPMAVVHYGYKVSPRGQQSHSPGRVLFAGGTELRKGVHYLAEAALALRGARKLYDFRVAGQASARVRSHPRAKALTFLGHLSREQLDEEFRLADLFVAPSLAEGSATAVFEALAAGLPIVTTRSTGSVVTDGRDGLIVAERDSHALAAAIQRIVEDRALRASMSANALAAAASFDEGPWGERLIAALETLHA